MKQFIRFLSSVLILCNLVVLMPIKSMAAGDDITEADLHVRISKSEKPVTKIIPVLIHNQTIYATPDTLEQITRYHCEYKDHQLIFRLGIKYIVVDTSANSLEVNLVPQTFSGVLLAQDAVYLPLAEMLAWMNVSCSVGPGTLNITSDPVSYWEIVDGFDSTKYEYSLSEHFGNTASGKTSFLVSAFFDSILHFFDDYWKRLVKDPNSQLTTYEYETYMECFRDFALPDEDSPENLYSTMSDISSYLSSHESGYESLCDIFFNEDTYPVLESWIKNLNSDKFEPELDSFFKDFGYVEKAAKLIYDVTIYGSLMLKNTEDYAHGLQYIYLRKNADVPVGIQNVAQDAIKMLDSYSGAFREGFSDITGSFIEDKIQDAVTDQFENMMGDGFLGSLGAYLSIIDDVLSITWPINESFSELNKMAVYQTMQYDALNAFYSIPTYRNELSPEDIRNARISLILFLKTSKKCFEAEDDLFAKFGSANINDWLLEEMNGLLAELQTAAISETHDAICDKSAATDHIETCLNDILKPLLLPEEPQPTNPPEDPEPTHPKEEAQTHVLPLTGFFYTEDSSCTLEITQVTPKKIGFNVIWETTSETCTAFWNSRDGVFYFTSPIDDIASGRYMKIIDPYTVMVYVSEDTNSPMAGEYLCGYIEQIGNEEEMNYDDMDMIYENDIGFGWVRPKGSSYPDSEMIVLTFGQDTLIYTVPDVSVGMFEVSFSKKPGVFVIDGNEFAFTASRSSNTFTITALMDDPQDLSGQYEVYYP